MTQEQFKHYASEMLAEAYDVMSDKGDEYAQNTNAFANFEHSADEAGITREQAWVVHFNKHVAALNRAARGQELRTDTVRGRCIDVINYAIFLSAMLTDKTMVLPAGSNNPPTYEPFPFPWERDGFYGPDGGVHHPLGSYTPPIDFNADQ